MPRRIWRNSRNSVGWGNSSRTNTPLLSHQWQPHRYEHQRGKRRHRHRRKSCRTPGRPFLPHFILDVADVRNSPRRIHGCLSSPTSLSRTTSSISQRTVPLAKPMPSLSLLSEPRVLASSFGVSVIGSSFPTVDQNWEEKLECRRIKGRVRSVYLFSIALLLDETHRTRFCRDPRKNRKSSSH